jgi:hypothetical protein
MLEVVDRGGLTVASHSHIWLGRMDMENIGEEWAWACTRELCIDTKARHRWPGAGDVGSG